MNYLLDTNTWIDHLRYGPNSKVTSKLARGVPGSIYLCSVVLGELLVGAYRSGPTHQAANLALIASLRQQFLSLSFDDPAAAEYGKIRAQLAGMGKLIGPNDLLIAAIALAHGLTLVTHNTKEFHRVPSLTVEDWQ